MSTYPTSADLAAMRRTLAGTDDPYDWGTRGVAHPFDDGAWPHEREHGIGYRYQPYSGHNRIWSANEQSQEARREANRLRREAFERMADEARGDAGLSIDLDAAMLTFAPDGPVPGPDTVCECGHWYEEHDGGSCAGCDALFSGMDAEADAQIAHPYRFDPEQNTPEMIADRGGDPAQWPAWVMPKLHEGHGGAAGSFWPDCPLCPRPHVDGIRDDEEYRASDQWA